MEKILLALDAAKADTGALEFASWLATLTSSKVTGVFLENPAEERAEEIRPVLQGTATGYTPGPEGRSQNILFFTGACQRRSTRYSVHTDNGDPVKELIKESRFADVLVLDPETSFSRKPEAVPTSFARNILKDIECPVIIAPESFEGIEEIIFTYDGSKSSMFAIKQFCYLFPQLDEKKVTLLQVTESEMVPHANQENLKEWLCAHYNSIGFVTLAGFPTTELLAYLIRKENAIVVMGAYGRTTFPAVFAHSHADPLIRTLGQAIFIAHY